MEHLCHKRPLIFAFVATERNIIRKIVVCLISLLVTSYAVIVERCPTDRAERVARAIKLCSSIERYHCMFNTEHLLQEECIDYKQLPPGHYPIYNSFATGNPIDYEICPLDRYQPWPAKSYEITECVSTKSHCASEGQVLCNTGSTSVDIICQCDNKKGYSSASGKCCNPLGQEDCSCFKKIENDNIEPDVGCICVETGNSSETSKRVVNTTDDTSMDTRYTIGNDGNRYLFFSDGNPMFIAVASSTFILFLILCYILHIELYRYWNYIMTLVLTFLIIGCCVLNIFLYKDKVFHPLLGIFITTLVANTVCITGILIAFFYSTREKNKVYNEDYELRIFRLLQAAAKGDVDELQRFAEEKYIDMDDIDYDGRNALHVAVCAGRVEAVEYILINNYCILNATDRRGRSAYDYATEYEGNNKQKIKELLENYKDEPLAKTSKKKFKDSIVKDLIDAAAIGDETILKRLRDEGTDMNLSNSDGRTALHTAVKYGHNNIVKYLLDECKVSPFIRSQDKRPDHVDWQNIASSKNEKIEEKLRKTMKEMLRSKDDAKDQRPPEEDLQIVRLFHCAAVGDIQRMRLFQRSGYKMDLSNYDNRTALHIAASYKQDFIVDFLLEKCHLSNAAREAIDRWGVTPLMEAKATHAVIPEVYNAFLKNCQIVNTENDDYRTFRLLNAGAKDDLTELKTLHDKKIDMNLRDYDGRTALHLAAAEGNLEAVKFLVETAKVTVDIPDREGRRPIDEATNEEIKNYLKLAPHDATKSSKSYEKLSTKDTDMTYIMKTVSKGRLHKLNDERLDYFSMDSCDYFKNTPLHVASAKARLEDVEYLLHKRQVSPFVRNSFMETPLDLVEKKIKFWERKAGIMTLQDTSQDMQMERSREDDFSKVKKKLKEAMASASKDDVEEDDTFKIHTKEERLFLFLNKAYKGDLKSIRRYLKTDKTLIGEVNYDKRSALHLAAAEGHYDLVRFILDLKDYPVNVNAEDRWKKTPLLDAKRIADEDIINLFLDANKDAAG